MSEAIRFVDLLSLLRKLGFDCDTIRDGVRLCEHLPLVVEILLTELSPDEIVSDLLLTGVKLQLDRAGLMPRETFDRGRRGDPR